MTEEEDGSQRKYSYAFTTFPTRASAGSDGMTLVDLEVTSRLFGWEVVRPPKVMGKSGVMHRFSFMAVKGDSTRAVDVYGKVSEGDVISTFTKSYDTGTSGAVIFTSEPPTEAARRLAKEYALDIVSARDIATIFRREPVLEAPREAARALV